MRSRPFGIELPKQMPIFDRLMKHARHRLFLLSAAIAHGKRAPSIVVYPDFPSRKSALFKMCRSLKWELTNAPRTSPSVCIRFEDQTEKNTPMPPWFASYTVWNDQCLDIRKSTLENAHIHAFGHGMSVDPCKYHGTMVVKSEFNARHDGRAIQGPIKMSEKSTNSVYQLDIQNTDKQGKYYDFRLVYIRGKIPVVYKKIKSADTRFTNQCESAHLIAIDDAISPIEVERTIRLMEKLHADYAELDALRDASSGKLFIIDVNPTPWGPPSELPPEQQSKAVRLMAKAFEQAILDQTTESIK